MPRISLHVTWLTSLLSLQTFTGVCQRYLGTAGSSSLSLLFFFLEAPPCLLPSPPPPPLNPRTAVTQCSNLLIIIFVGDVLVR